MLGKLLKYEIKATQRLFLPIYGLILILALVNKLFFSINAGYLNIPKMIMMSAYVIMIIALIIMTFVVTIQRFYKNLLCDEGYLSFTLPVKSHMHIEAKMIVTLMWVILSTLVSALSIFLLAIDRSNIQQFSEFCMELSQMYSYYGFPAVLATIEFILLIILGVVTSTLQIYASVVVGNLSGKHRMLAGIGAYIGFGIVEQIISSILMNILKNPIESYFSYFHFSKDSIPFNAINMGLLILILYSLIFGLAYFFFTNWMLNRKLNLE